MKKENILSNGIPITDSLDSDIESDNSKPRIAQDKKRLFLVSSMAVLIAIAVSFVAKLLVYLINFFTNISFHGTFSLANVSPANNSLGLFVIIIPVIGGVLVGLMALYGSKAIRGHGIPEAMEQILVNQSKIHPSITFLKPVSSAISIGTGGPFGAEGPIIATGGALGSTLGQLIKITPNERKILLAAGATAGMAAIFGSPIAAIFLAIELLLFEFSPRSIIPVALACITAAAGHHLLFGSAPIFQMPDVQAPNNIAIAVYSALGIIIGVIAAFVTKIVYFIEDTFEKLPIHWMWWPAIGGVFVGIIGYFAPRTLGVGYYNITDILSGTMSLKIIFALCFLKFVSWAIALGSGTSGGTLAPLLTIGGAAGALLGSLALYLFPHCGITLPLAALVAMSAMFAGASRALLTSIIFAVETTEQPHALLPLLSACTASYFISFFLMENTIMTEKIARKGVKTPHSFEPDLLEKITVEQVIKDGVALSANNSIKDIRDWLTKESNYNSNFFVIVDDKGEFKGIVSSSSLNSDHRDDDTLIGSLIKRKSFTISSHDNLRTAVEMMAKENLDVLPVVSNENKNSVIGILSYKDILSVYKYRVEDFEKLRPHISLKRSGMKILLHGQKLIDLINARNN
jgi:chloride channel protein, CIC family